MKDFWLRLAIAALVVFLGAVPLAQASGFTTAANPQEHNSAHVFAGVILFLLSMALFGPATRLAGRVIALLGRVENRPGPIVALGLIICGTLCVISSLALAWMGRPQSRSADFSQVMQGMVDRITPQMALSITMAGSSAGAMILTVGVFLVGTTLIALGVWAAIEPRRTTGALAGAKPPAPEFADLPT